MFSYILTKLNIPDNHSLYKKLKLPLEFSLFSICIVFWKIRYSVFATQNLSNIVFQIQYEQLFSGQILHYITYRFVFCNWE